MEVNTQKGDQKSEVNIMCTNFVVQVREEQELTGGDKKEVKELTSGENGQYGGITLVGGTTIEAKLNNNKCFYDKKKNEAYREINGKKIIANNEIMEKACREQKAKGKVQEIDPERGM